MELAVYNISGKDTGRKVTLSDDIFGIEPNDHAIYLDVKQFLANQRQGTHKSKERGEITGSTRKIKKQKGTGTARLGDIKSPILRGGARAFGPKPRDYSFKLNKKVKPLARKSALAYKAKEDGIMVIEDFSFDQPKTKTYLKMINDLKVNDIKTLFVSNEIDNNVFLSSRNIQGTRLKRAADLNTYEVMYAKKLILSESSVKTIEEILKK